MTPSGSTVLWDVKEVLMPLKGMELFNKYGSGSNGEQSSARWTQNNCHGISCDPWGNDNVVRVTQALQSFMGTSALRGSS